jgi:ABC-type dipeptide/oligopeptide/nickel transport system permease subunit
MSEAVDLNEPSAVQGIRQLDAIAPPQVSERTRFFRILFQRKLVMFGVGVLVILVIVGIFAPLIANQDPYKNDLAQSLQPISRDHIMGTDSLGRDTFSRLVYGARTALIVGFGTVAVASIAGIILGLLAGYLGGTYRHHAHQGCADGLSDAHPGPAPGRGSGGWDTERHHRSGHRHAAGLHPAHVRRDPERQGERVHHGAAGHGRKEPAHHGQTSCPAFQPTLVLITAMLGNVILAEAALSFLGIGIKPPGVAWGSMAADGYRYLGDHAQLSFAPAIAIMVVVFAFNMVGDGLRDALDPKLRGVL